VQLGVNIDHIATVRQARRAQEPDPVVAARLCEQAGCDSIVAHLREDRRHMQDRDIARLRDAVTTRLNLEMSVAPEIVRIACRIRPDQATLVPERRQELTTEGGLDVAGGGTRLSRAIETLQRAKMRVSLFIDPSRRQIAAAARLGIGWIELHTGAYANSRTTLQARRQLRLLGEACRYARSLGLRVNAGHGLDYRNVRAIGRIRDLEELNIGHAIVARACLVGIGQAVREMLALIR